MPFIAGKLDPTIIIGQRFQKLISDVPEIEAAKVHFSRGYEIQSDDTPCISVEIGEDLPNDPDGQQNSNHTDSTLIINVDLYQTQNDSEAMIDLGYYRALVHRAVFQDHKLGMPGVIATRYGGASEPADDEEAGLPGWTMRLPFPVHYRFNYQDRTVFNSG